MPTALPITPVSFSIDDKATAALKVAYDVAIARGLVSSEIPALPANLFAVSTSAPSPTSAVATITPSNDALKWVQAVLAKATR